MQRIVHTGYGEPVDVLKLEPLSDDRALTIKGISLFSWQSEPVTVREADLAKALELARDFPNLFPVAQRYLARDYRAALEHAQRRGKTGTVLLTF
jgi:NADPH2:quinone reductase